MNVMKTTGIKCRMLTQDCYWNIMINVAPEPSLQLNNYIFVMTKRSDLGGKKI